jgi:hypothetical protein
MKLTINRKEEQKRFLKKKTYYILETHLELTASELALVKKHKWDEESIGEATFNGNWNSDSSIGMLIGTHTPAFDSIECLAYYEDLVITALKGLKQRLAAAANFETGGPVEVDLSDVEEQSIDDSTDERSISEMITEMESMMPDDLLEIIAEFGWREKLKLILIGENILSDAAEDATTAVHIVLLGTGNLEEILGERLRDVHEIPDDVVDRVISKVDAQIFTPLAAKLAESDDE